MNKKTLQVNSNKDYKAPWQIIKGVRPKIDLELAGLPPLMIGWVRITLDRNNYTYTMDRLD